MTGRVFSGAAKGILTRAVLSGKRGPGAQRGFHWMALASEASGSPTGTMEGCPERINSRSHLRWEANPDLQKVVFPFYNGLK